MAVELKDLLARGREGFIRPIPSHDQAFLDWTHDQAERRIQTRERFEQTPLAAIQALLAAKVDSLEVVLPSDKPYYGYNVTGQIKLSGDVNFWRDEVWERSTGVFTTALAELAGDFENYLNELRWQRAGFAPVRKYGFEGERDESTKTTFGLHILDNAAPIVNTMGIREIPRIGSVEFRALERDFSIRQLPLDKVTTHELGFADMLQYAMRFGDVVSNEGTATTVQLAPGK